MFTFRDVGSPIIVLSTCLCLLPLTANSAESDYIKAMEAASGGLSGTKKPKSSGDAGADETAAVIDNPSREEFERMMATEYPEEYALYKRLDVKARAEVLAEFDRYADQPDDFRYMKAINRLGLLSGSGGWEY